MTNHEPENESLHCELLIFEMYAESMKSFANSVDAVVSQLSHIVNTAVYGDIYEQVCKLELFEEDEEL